MENGTLDFLADYPSWKAIYRSRIRENDEISKFLTFATIVDKEISRKVPDLLEEFGIEKKIIEDASDSISMVLDDSLNKKTRKAVTKVPRGLRKMILAYVLRNALIASKVPILYDPSKIKEAKPIKNAGKLKFEVKHKLWNRSVVVDLKEGDSSKKFIQFAAEVDDEIMMKIPVLFKELGVDLERLEGMIENVAEEIDHKLPKEVMDTLSRVNPELREIAGACAVRSALEKKKIPYQYRREKIKKLVKEL